MTQATVPVVVATQRINGTILPGVLFTPDSIEDHADLVRMDAVREPSEAELLLHERMLENTAASTGTSPAKPRGGRKSKADQEAEAAAAAEAEAAAAAEAEAAAAAEAEAAAAAAAAIG